LVGGVGVANAVAAHLARKRDTIATMKALGAPGGTVVAIYCWQIMLIALFAACIGAALGAALPYVAAWFFGALLPFPVAPGFHPDVLTLAVGYGLLTAFAFALWPLGRAHDTPVSTLLRGPVGAERSWPRLRYLLATGLAIAAVAGLAISFAYDTRLTAIFAVSAAGLFAVLRLVAAAIMAGVRRVPRLRPMLLRLAAANIHRPGAVTPSIVLSLGIGFSCDGCRDRGQFAPRTHGGLAAARAVIFLHRYSRIGGAALRRTHSPASAKCRARAGADVAREDYRSKRRQSRRS
jgi:putative ABC transport system permease protein